MLYRIWLNLVVVASCAAAFVGSALGAEREVEKLFEIIGPRVDLVSHHAAAEQVFAIEILPISVDTRAFDLTLPGLRPDERVLRAKRDDLERRSADSWTWRGWLDEEERSRVVLTFHHGYLAGLIVAPDGLYEITPTADGGHALLDLDSSRFPSCGGAVVDDRGQLVPEPLPAGSDPASDIDLLSLYTPEARNAAGGVSQIQATIQSAVDVSNTAFIDSDMTARFDLVLTVLALRNDSGDSAADLSWLRSDPTVATLRDDVAADLVSLIVDTSDACGRGYVMRNPGPSFESLGFQVTTRACAVGNLSFAHEHGHNMGLEHNPEDSTADPSQASYPWSFGHYVDGSFRTVMSYSNPCSSCPRAPHFSNPDVTHSGAATGIAAQRDNARSGDLTAPIVANFRMSTGNNSPPHEPTSPFPFDGAVEVATSTILAWAGGDPDGDAVTYDVYLEVGDSTPDQLVCQGSSVSSCLPPVALSPSATYFWRVQATDPAGATASSSVWSFTTAGTTCVDDVYETEGSGNSNDECFGGSLVVESGQVHQHCDEDWVYFSAAAGATYRIETTALQGGADTTLAIHELCGSQLAFDDDGGVGLASRIDWTATSDTIFDVRIREFADAYAAGEAYTISVSCIANCTSNNPPFAPNSPTPADGATNVDIVTQLSWLGGDPDGDTVTYDVYLEAGTSTPSVLICSDVTTSACAPPSDLEYATEYRWVVVAEDSNGAATSSDVWAFTTADPAECIDDAYETQGSGDSDDQCFGALTSVPGAQQHSHCDEDWIFFVATAGATYRIETSNLLNFSDTTLSVHHACGPELAFDDDGGSGLASLIEWTPTLDTPVDVRIRQFADDYVDGEGYTVTVTCVANCGGALFADGFESGDLSAWGL